MTWGEFKRRIEEAGATDDMEIDYIDVSALVETYGLHVSVNFGRLVVHD